MRFSMLRIKMHQIGRLPVVDNFDAFVPSVYPEPRIQ